MVELIKNDKACEDCTATAGDSCDGPCPQGAEFLIIPEQVTKEAVEGFESIRTLGPVNMMDRRGVQHEAPQRGYEDLAYLDKPEYMFILANYEELLAHYAIEKGVICQPTQ